MDRAGKSYRHKQFNIILLVVKSTQMSAGTSRHEAIVLDASQTSFPMAKPVVEGQSILLDEVPIASWEDTFVEV